MKLSKKEGAALVKELVDQSRTPGVWLSLAAIKPDEHACQYFDHIGPHVWIDMVERDESAPAGSARESLQKLIAACDERNILLRCHCDDDGRGKLYDYYAALGFVRDPAGGQVLERKPAFKIPEISPWSDEREAPNGKRIQDNFKSWFKQSKAIEPTGLPKVFYHGSNVRFDEFVKPETNRMSFRATAGFWFTSEVSDARQYGEHVHQVFLRAAKPKVLTRRDLDFLAVSEPMDRIVSKLRAAGYDSILLPAMKPDPVIEDKGHPMQMVVFDPDQIKSMDRNCGLFAKGNADITDNNLVQVHAKPRTSRP